MDDQTTATNLIAGEFVTETFGYDGGRQVTVYVPPNPLEAIVFAGDGQGISQWGGYFEVADVSPAMIVGVHGLTDEMARLEEYPPVDGANYLQKWMPKWRAICGERLLPFA